MTLKEWWNHPSRRPIWQIPLITPIYLLYFVADKYVDFVDRNF
jgi:hypothetical protein